MNLNQRNCFRSELIEHELRISTFACGRIYTHQILIFRLNKSDTFSNFFAGVSLSTSNESQVLVCDLVQIASMGGCTYTITQGIKKNRRSEFSRPFTMDDPFALEVNVGSMNGNESCRETQNQDLPQQDARDFFPTSKHRASLGNRDKNV